MERLSRKYNKRLYEKYCLRYDSTYDYYHATKYESSDEQDDYGNMR